MIQLKKYQQRALHELTDYLNDAKTLGGEKGIRYAFMDKLGDEVKAYKTIVDLESTPFVCIKIPTGGGKTLIASHSLGSVHDTFNKELNRVGLVVWLVPSDAIRQQTLNALKNKNHPYREAIDLQFDNNVKVFTVEEALSGITKADVEENLCIVVSSLAAFRRDDPSWLKAFKDSGALISHFSEVVDDSDFLDKAEDGEVINSLINVIKMNRPIVILDEGHNAQTALSFDMFRRLSPSVILEFTATPRKESNVLVEVRANELKEEKMVKIPIYLTNVSQWQEAIRDGINKRKDLEKVAKAELKATKEYIRPIVLIQAEQDKEDEEKIHVKKVKDFLTEELKIPDHEIAIKTAKTDQISSVDLLSSDTNINYIITVNALKEGWDCPFAYILISASKIGSRVAVEQTIGRILRLPNVKEKKNIELNYSYVYSSSENFSKASSAIIKGLENNGYSKDDLRQLTGTVKKEKDYFERQIKDNVEIPAISKKGSVDILAFNKDLIGMEFNLSEHYSAFDFNFLNDQDASIKIDIDEEQKIVKYVQGRLVFTYHMEDFSREELFVWLKKNVQNRVISVYEMSQYIDLALTDLLKAFTIQDLSINRYKLKDKIGDEVKAILAKYADRTFVSMLTNKELVVDEINVGLPLQIQMSRISPEIFTKHLFERAGYMNGEETDFAFALNDLPNLAWWYRNREKEDYYLQGAKPNKFYPDFIAKTNDGRYILAEYKGEDRLTNEDTAWKKELGELWQKLSGNQHSFFMLGKKDIVETIKAISEL